MTTTTRTTAQLTVSHLVSLVALLALGATIPLADRVASELRSLSWSSHADAHGLSSAAGAR